MRAVIISWLARALGVPEIQRDLRALNVRLIELEQLADELAERRQVR